jgi:hypothetical protein
VEKAQSSTQFTSVGHRGIFVFGKFNELTRPQREKSIISSQSDFQA